MEAGTVATAVKTGTTSGKNLEKEKRRRHGGRSPPSVFLPPPKDFFADKQLNARLGCGGRGGMGGGVSAPTVIGHTDNEPYRPNVERARGRLFLCGCNVPGQLT